MAECQNEVTSQKMLRLWDSLYRGIITVKPLQCRVANGEVITYSLWLKRATGSLKSRRHFFRKACCLPASELLCAF